MERGKDGWTEKKWFAIEDEVKDVKGRKKRMETRGSALGRKPEKVNSLGRRHTYCFAGQFTK